MKLLQSCYSWAAAAIVGVVALASFAAAEDWPGWRGPRGDGISQDASAPLRWSPTENIAWKTLLPGNGRSSPIVWGDRVFVTAGDVVDQLRRVICVDRVSGKQL